MQQKESKNCEKRSNVIRFKKNRFTLNIIRSHYYEKYYLIISLYFHKLGIELQLPGRF